MNALSFNQVSLNRVSHTDNQIWITSAELAKALGYKAVDSVTKIFNRNSDEFTEQMSTTVNLTVVRKTGSVVMPVRIFSLRGCYAIAFFAKTEVAKQFRKWVLDLIETEAQKFTGRSTTTDERTGLRDAVNAIVSKKSMLYPDAYKLVHQRFNVQHIDELTLEQVGEATEYLHRLLLTTEKPSGYVLEEHQVKNLVNAAQSMDWIFCWFNHYKMALSVINPKMVSSVSEHFKVVWIHTQNFGRKHDMVALNHMTMRDYPWDADYESQKDWRKVVGIYK
ncbi:BRO-N domain-containing protein [Vitreoscilla stercoraria]|uniref:Bro-N domain-containing protein n=1 Tax=Vitreoscilla stercoraria TaxID=61 RepID=A0ABY4ECB0_VITST|nr:BRO family protein [Vitreoscilla stercoraria]UOO93384.1 hypothetical protein LVJ81_04975 [Vitreoscilla stercoraria]